MCANPVIRLASPADLPDMLALYGELEGQGFEPDRDGAAGAGRRSGFFFAVVFVFAQSTVPEARARMITGQAAWPNR